MMRGLVCMLMLAAAGTVTAEPMRPAFAGKRVGEQQLAVQRGGTDLGPGASLQGSVAGSTATNVSTGANVITGGALSNAAGVPVVVQNSGNNVVVQSSTIINLTLTK